MLLWSPLACLSHCHVFVSGTQWLEVGIAHLTSAPCWVIYLRVLQEAVWPGGDLPMGPQPVRSPEQREETRLQCLDCLMKLFPELIPDLLGCEKYKLSWEHVLESLQDPHINRCASKTCTNSVSSFELCGTVVQCIALWPHTKKSLGSISGRVFSVPSVWSLPVLPCPHGLLPGAAVPLIDQQHAGRLIGDAKLLPVCVCVTMYVRLCPYDCPVMKWFDETPVQHCSDTDIM
ncbi:hypothetical protein NFI96_002081, partial [Prochilodus magdalenae]